MKISPAVLAFLGIGAAMAMASSASAATVAHSPLPTRNTDFKFPTIQPNKTSERGIAFIKDEEGFAPRVYQDVGKNAIGYGHNFIAGDGLKVTTVLTQAQADALLRKDIVSREKAINRLVRAPLTQGMYDALASFVYNIGEPRFGTSTMLKLINARDYIGAAQQFDLWINAGGKVSPVLVGRRNREENLFLTGA